MAKKNATSKKIASKIKKTEAKEVKITKKVASESESFLSAKNLTAFTAEFIGTFILTAVVLSGSGQPIVVLFGLMAIVLIVGKVSGAHVNPLITIGAWSTRRISTVKALSYFLAQLIGAMLAFVVLKFFVDQAPEVSAEMQRFGQRPVQLFAASAIPEGKELVVLLAEFIGSTIFAFSVASVTGDKNKKDSAIALGVGSGLFVAVLIAGSAATAVGASAILNPAVAIGLQAFTIEGANTLWAIATYMGAALLGGICGFAINNTITKYSDK